MASRVRFLLAFVAILGGAVDSVLAVEWEAEQALTTHRTWSYVGYNNARCIVTSGRDVHVIWSDNRYVPASSEVMYRHSPDQGRSWDSYSRVSNELFGSSDYPALAVAAGNRHVVWRDDRDANTEIYYRRSRDGVDWGESTRLSDNPATSEYPAVAANLETVHVVWEDARDGSTEVYYRRSADGGTSWQPVQRLTDALGSSAFPSLTVAGTKLYVVWHDLRDGRSEIYLKRSDDDGVTFSQDQRLTNHLAASENPSLVVAGTVLDLTWMDRRDDAAAFEVYFMRSVDDGASWGEPRRLSFAAGQSYNPSIAASGSGIHVLWHDERYGNPEIFYAGSDDGGTTWSAELNLSNDPDVSYSPFVALTSSWVHVIWQDGRNPGQGNHDIFYRRGRLPLRPRLPSGRRNPG